jgi:LuxR family quorum-sensing system transcriptional regulator CciR
MITRLLRMIDGCETVENLTDALAEATAQMGFQNFALTHHSAPTPGRPGVIRLHNYPTQWVDHYDQNALVFRDPVHRASHVTSLGFPWCRLSELVPLTHADLRMLELGREQGIGDGFTVPVHVPGEARGSVSFVVRTGQPMPDMTVPLAHLVGASAFEVARRLCTGRGQHSHVSRPALTDRQRDCVVWAARGKSDVDIATILGLSRETVTQHIKHAYERYDVNKRTPLVVRTLFDGTVSLSEVMPWRYPHFWG